MVVSIEARQIRTPLWLVGHQVPPPPQALARRTNQTRSPSKIAKVALTLGTSKDASLISQQATAHVLAHVPLAHGDQERRQQNAQTTASQMASISPALKNGALMPAINASVAIALSAARRLSIATAIRTARERSAEQRID